MSGGGRTGNDVDITNNKEGSGEERYNEVLQRSRCQSHMARNVLVTCENAHFFSLFSAFASHSSSYQF